MKLPRPRSKAKWTVAVSLIVAIGAVYWFKSHNRLSGGPNAATTSSVIPSIPKPTLAEKITTKSSQGVQVPPADSQVQELVQSHEDGTKVFKTKEGFATVLPDGKVITLPDEL
ncbi:MAG: hypothetical protein EOP04_09345 [Proteobacteria bacterium]|nr:MAG: hypothetical protein EOP04_09345 [Pseudomonadota bacterium]